MRYKVSNFDLLVGMLASVSSDDVRLPWQSYPCLEWPRGKNTGYGQLMKCGGPRESLVHREAYKLFHGSIPDGMDILHRCDNPPCFRPAHLFHGTHADNMRDCWEKGRVPGIIRPAIDASSAKRRAMTHCKRGHEYTEKTVYYDAKGSRCCRPCRCIRQKKYRHKRDHL